MTSEELKELRNSKGLTQTEFAEKLGINIRTVQNWEGGTNIPKSKEMLIRSIFVKRNEYFEENEINADNLISEPEDAYPGNIKKLAYESIKYHNQLMKLPQYEAHIKYLTDLRMVSKENLRELKKMLDED